MNEINLKITGVNTITLPSACQFYPDRVDLIMTSGIAVNAEGAIAFGNSTNIRYLLNDIKTSNLTGTFERNVFSNLISGNGQTSLTFTVITGYTAGAASGRAFFRGLLIENE